MTSETSSPLFVALRVSAALAVVAGAASAASFVFWQLFHRDVAMGIGNMRGTAFSVLFFALPVLVASMIASRRGSLRAQLLWLGTLAYLAYNAVMFCFAPRFNALFLAFSAWLGLSFWGLLTLLRAVDLSRIRACTERVPVRTIAVYLLACALLFAGLWLQAIVPATVSNAFPAVLDEAGLSQNPIWVLDFAFTFPLMVLGSVWMWQRRAWGLIIGGMMTWMLTLETAGIAVDQWFGHLHDPKASLAAVPVMIFFTFLGLGMSTSFLRAVSDDVPPPPPRVT
jgi:hypothetical protein